MVDDMYATYRAQLIRAFKQAPWRTQTQAVATWSITLLVIAVLGGLYLDVASRAGTAGRDLQAFEARKAALIQSNDELRAELSQLRSVTRLANRARDLGFIPAQPDQIEYLAVHNYPQPVVVAAPAALPSTAAAVGPASPLAAWFTQALRGLVTAEGG